MPTPVGAARQCLSDSAAAVLDDAVAAARRRSHAQTTTLHVVSALLAVPSSPLREACTRAWSSAYSPRLQFRALELCVGVALDRVSASKSAAADEPPVSNSLMAAIKRSQASQRRHPETFHLYQQQLNSGSQNTQSISAVKVELKHFLTSILDDPIVSRVFGDAGFRTQEIKMAVLNPLSMSRFAVTASRPPPLFACSLDNFELDRRAHSFPFIDAAAMEKLDENQRKIREVLLKKTRRNPLLIGASGSDAHRNFLDCLKKGESGVLPKELDGLTVLSIEREISECISEHLSEAMIGLKFKKVDELVENCQGAGIIANCGDLKEFLDVELLEFVSNVVLKMKRLLIKHGGRLWLMGFLADDDDYKKLVEQFPCIEMDLDLHLLPITASSIGGKPFKSSLMRSFVPFGGFFSMSSELKTPRTNVTKTMKLCSSCNEKYENEVSDVQKGVSTDSVADNQSVNLSSWLQIAECETSKKSCTEEAKKDKNILDARILALQRKWSGICQRLHHSWTSQVDTTLLKPHTFVATTLQHVPIRKDAVSAGSLSDGNNMTNMSPCMSPDWQKNSPPKQNVPRTAELSASVIAQAEVPAQGLGLNDFQKSSSSQHRTSLPIACTFSPSVVSVATDLTLGTFCDSSEEFRRNPSLQDDDCSGVQNSESSRIHEKSMSQLSQSSSCSHHHGKQMYAKDLEHQWGVLAEKVYWQSEAIQTIGRTVSRCKNENARYDCSKKRNVWLSFVGPDKVGKRKIAASVAEIAFGRKDRLLYLDLCAQGANPFDYIVDSYDSKYLKMQPGRELMVDYLAGELSKHPDSVVLLENVEKADFVVRCSLSQAIKTGKFPDSRGRPIYLNNNIFILASTVVKGSKHLLFGKDAPDFPEETILEAKNMQMQILVEPVGGEIHRRHSTTRVSLFPSEIISKKFCSSKRKLMNDGSTKGEISKRACQLSRSFDLNLPVDGGEEDSDIDKSDDDYSDDSEVWLGELLEHVDENVVSKAFDFDSLSQKILREIDARLRKIVGATILLEIDRQVMVQILAAAWLTEREEALENWIEQVLCSGIDEARKRCSVASDFVLRLVPCEGLVVKAQASRVCLPAKINV